jgi:hypothetical protein
MEASKWPQPFTQPSDQRGRGEVQAADRCEVALDLSGTATRESAHHGGAPLRLCDDGLERRSNSLVPRDDKLGRQTASPKERVVFIERGAVVAVPFSTLQRQKRFRVEVGEPSLDVRWRRGDASSLDAGSVAEGREVGAAEVREGERLVAFDESEVCNDAATSNSTATVGVSSAAQRVPAPSKTSATGSPCSANSCTVLSALAARPMSAWASVSARRRIAAFAMTCLLRRWVRTRTRRPPFSMRELAWSFSNARIRDARQLHRHGAPPHLTKRPNAVDERTVLKWKEQAHSSSESREPAVSAAERS